MAKANDRMAWAGETEPEIKGNMNYVFIFTQIDCRTYYML